MGESSLKAVPASGRESGGLVNSAVNRIRGWTSLVTTMPGNEFRYLYGHFRRLYPDPQRLPRNGFLVRSFSAIKPDEQAIWLFQCTWPNCRHSSSKPSDSAGRRSTPWNYTQVCEDFQVWLGIRYYFIYRFYSQGKSKTHRFGTFFVLYYSGGSKGGTRDTPWGSKFFQFYAVFGKIVCWRPHGELALPPRGNPGSAIVLYFKT